jgi:dTDP-3-amino-3,4,6-trideoxy-alpha-D-glucose transaminase
MNTNLIPQAQPLAQYLAYREEIDAAVHRVLSAGRYILGAEVSAFENEFAAYCGTGYASAVASGTDALVLALRSCCIGQRDEVITTPHTAVATVAAIELAGAKPVLCDIEPDTLLINPVEIERMISPRTRAIIPVHLFGQPVDLQPILDLAERHNIRVIEDCAQAHGAFYRGKRVGSWGSMGCFSFYPTKNLGAIGDGGMIVTDDDELSARIQMLREYGWKRRFISETAGTNSRLDELQAAILRVKLRHLDSDNEKRRVIAAQYTDALAGHLSVPVSKTDRAGVFHLYVVQTENRADLQQHLEAHGIGTAVHYPVPVHLQPAYRGSLGDKGSFPVAERAAEQVLSLPLYPQLEASQVARVIDVILQHATVSSSARA